MDYRSMKTTGADIARFVRNQPLAVEATLPGAGAPQAAVIGVVASDALELFFDTEAGSRKHANLLRDGRIALVLGWDLETACTVQLEGVADAPPAADLERLFALYLDRFPAGADRRGWPQIRYWRVRPTWLRWSDFRGAAPDIVEITPVGTTWNAGRRVLETRLNGAVTLADLDRHVHDLAAEADRIPAGTSFKLMADFRGMVPASIEADRALVEALPLALSRHARGCAAHAVVHDGGTHPDNLRPIIGHPSDRKLFATRAEAEAWLDGRP